MQQNTKTNQFSTVWLRQFGGVIIQRLTDTFSDAAIYMVDKNQNITYWSLGAERLLGFSAAEVQGHHCLKGIRCVQCMKGCGVQQFGHIENVTLQMHTKQGESIHVEKTAHALYDSNNQFAGAIEILRPVATPATVTPRIGTSFHNMVTQSAVMKRLFTQIKSVAKTDAPVLARGESGTGKELVAQAIHLESERRDHPFVAVNCSAIPENLIESELFGHARGAFTGAHKARKGLFEQAHRGSLFLDEIAELPMTIQAKLLRVLETKKFKRVGENVEITVDVRIITATHKSLREAVSEGSFRQDLMFRLRVVPLFIPPLRERPEDIEYLLQHFIDTANTQHSNQILTIDATARTALMQHAWPGNVREIRNVIDYAFAIGCRNTLTVNDLPPEFSDGTDHQTSLDLSELGLSEQKTSHSALPKVLFSEKERISTALEQSNNKVNDAAKLLGMSRATLWRKRKQYGL